MRSRGIRPEARARIDHSVVVSSAARIADTEGLDAVSLTRVAEALDRHVSSLYSYVEGFDSLRRDIALLAIRELGESIQEAVIGRSGSDALERIAISYRDFVREHPGRYEAALRAERSSDPELAEASGKTMRTFKVVLEAFALDGEQAVHVYRIFTAAIRGFVQTEIAHGYSDSPAPDATFQRLIRFFVDVLVTHRWNVEPPPMESSVQR